MSNEFHNERHQKDAIAALKSGDLEKLRQVFKSADVDFDELMEYTIYETL